MLGNRHYNVVSGLDILASTVGLLVRFLVARSMSVELVISGNSEIERSH